MQQPKAGDSFPLRAGGSIPGNLSRLLQVASQCDMIFLKNPGQIRSVGMRKEMEMNGRAISFERIFNARDLGGLPTARRRMADAPHSVKHDPAEGTGMPPLRSHGFPWYIEIRIPVFAGKEVFGMKRLFRSAEIFLAGSTWKDLAAVKFCLFSLGLLAGLRISGRQKKPAALLAILVFLATYIPLMGKYLPILLYCREDDA